MILTIHCLRSCELFGTFENTSQNRRVGPGRVLTSWHSRHRGGAGALRAQGTSTLRLSEEASHRQRFLTKEALLEHRKCTISVLGSISVLSQRAAAPRPRRASHAPEDCRAPPGRPGKQSGGSAGPLPEARLAPPGADAAHPQRQAQQAAQRRGHSQDLPALQGTTLVRHGKARPARAQRGPVLTPSMMPPSISTLSPSMAGSQRSRLSRRIPPYRWDAGQARRTARARRSSALGKRRESRRRCRAAAEQAQSGASRPQCVGGGTAA